MLGRFHDVCVTVIDDNPTVKPNGSEGRDCSTAGEVRNQSTRWREAVKDLDPLMDAILLRPPGSCLSACIIPVFIQAIEQSL